MTFQTVERDAERALRETLRWATRDSHQRLDILFEDVVDPERTDIYEMFVRMNHACHEVIEPILAKSPLAAHLSFDHRRREALRSDLSAMDLDPLDLPAFPIPSPSLHEAIGIAYVLEGSRLGAAFLLRRFAELAVQNSDEPSRSYLAESARPGEFRDRMSTLSAFGWDDQSLDDAVRGARGTFDYFHQAACLAGAGPR